MKGISRTAVHSCGSRKSNLDLQDGLLDLLETIQIRYYSRCYCAIGKVMRDSMFELESVTVVIVKSKVLDR